MLEPPDLTNMVLAPRERDLMFVVGGFGPVWITAEQTAAFLRGYGAGVALDSAALAYYRFRRAVDDLGAFARETFLVPGLRETTRAAAAAGFRRLFEPGGICDLAWEAWRNGP